MQPLPIIPYDSPHTAEALEWENNHAGDARLTIAAPPRWRQFIGVVIDLGVHAFIGYLAFAATVITSLEEVTINTFTGIIVLTYVAIVGLGDLAMLIRVLARGHHSTVIAVTNDMIHIYSPHRFTTLVQFHRTDIAELHLRPTSALPNITRRLRLRLVFTSQARPRWNQRVLDILIPWNEKRSPAPEEALLRDVIKGSAQTAA